MAGALPDIPRTEFVDQVCALSPVPLEEPALAALWCHYQELRRWNPRLSLIGPGTLSEVMSRHYGESLQALPFLAGGSGRLLDVGSGAGFPGLVIAACRRDLEVTLVEPRERKWTFLRTVTHRAALSCHCLRARVPPAAPEDLPVDVSWVTLRAVRLAPRDLATLARYLAPEARLLLWTGGDAPELPAGFQVGGSQLLPGSQKRRILEVSYRGAPASD